ncbi:unnamed protein product [Oppiella nova]|uniref:Uncharacterized protein n=1 Tax=Oppiella nova TaxID=334625 RepID=A0A7R9MD59_9ACAR|nr:unnamed protein product [Oppiella nova]CAG2175051.1 unnamed protein product [Oppiella nova]
MGNKCMKDTVKLHMNDDYYCCQLWDLIECYQQNYQFDCTYAEQQSIQNDWHLLQLDFSGKVYTQSSCTNQGYQRTMDRRSYCTNVEQHAIQMDWYYIQLTFNGFSLTETKCNVQGYYRAKTRPLCAN